MSRAGVAAACSHFYSMVVNGRLTHLDDQLIEQQLGNAARSESGDDWRWTRKRSTGNIDAVMAVTLAAFGATAPPEDDE